MNRRRTTSRSEAVDPNDSDETFYEPDFDKHPDETRCFAEDSEAVDAYFEQTYNRYGLGLGSSWPPRSPRLGTDETYFSPAEAGQGQQHQGAPLEEQLNTDDTYFEPAEAVRAACGPLQLRGHAGPAPAPRRARPAPDARVVPESPPTHELDDGEEEAFFEEGDFGMLADAVGSAHGHGQLQDAGAESSGLFTHELEWSQVCWNLQQETGAEDIYFQIEDPMTQELRSYKLQGGGMNDPQSLSMFTEDLAWTQTQPCMPLANDGAHGMALVMTQGTQDLAWTQTQQFMTASTESQAMDASSAGVLGDLACEQLTAGPHGASASALASARSQLARQASSMSMEVVTRPPQRMPTNSSSLESSEPNVVPSLPSFDDDAAPAPLLPPHEQRNMEEIVASFRNISFVLDDNADAVVPQAAAVAEACSLQPSQGQGPPQGLPQGPRSPTFPTHPRRRGRPQRPRARTVPSNLREGQGGQGQANRSSSPVLGSGGGRTPSNGSKAHGKRKRSSVGLGSGSQLQQQHRRSQSAAPTCSPSSPPRRKARRNTCAPAPARNASKGRAEMITVYTRLQELRFYMQDVIRGREPLPSAEEVSLLNIEVLSIESNIKQVLKFDQASKQVKLKQEEALQVADKILHQLRVLAQMQQNSEAAHESPEDNILGTSWSNPPSFRLSESTPVNINKEAKPSDQTSPCKVSMSAENCTRISYNQKERSTVDSSNESNEKECHPLSREDILFEHEKDIPENNTENDTLPADSTFLRNDCLPDQANTTLQTSDVHPSCESTSPTLLQGPYVQSNCNTCISQQKNTPYISKEDIPDISCSSSAERSDLVTTTELPIHTNDFDETNFISSDKVNSPEKHKEEGVNEAHSEYQQLVSLIKMTSEISRSEAKEKRKVTDYVWKGGPLKLTGILLPKSSELTPIDDLPPNFWDDPQAPIPEEWVNMLEWDDE